VNKPVIFGGAAVVIAAVASLWLLKDGESERSPTLSSQNPVSAPVAQAPTVATPTVADETQQPAPAPFVAAVPSSADEDDNSEDPTKMFKADAAGNLALAERTRINVEKMLWIYSPEEQRQRLAVIEQTLPAGAYRQLVDLMDRYQNFTIAAKQTYPPDVSPATVEDAITQYEGLSALRKAHFGTEAAEAMFGREEKINRQLLEFMNLEKHEGMTMEEKAMKAQEMLSKSPELAAIYDQNRAESERTK
jgi:hypothetical protein